MRKGFGLVMVLVSVAVIAIMAFVFAKWIGDFERDVKNQGPTESNSYLPGIGGERRSGVYTVDGETVEVFARCGNNICEPYERCTPQNLDSLGEETGDCGTLYCPQDCQGLK